MLAGGRRWQDGSQWLTGSIRTRRRQPQPSANGNLIAFYPGPTSSLPGLARSRFEPLTPRANIIQAVSDPEFHQIHYSFLPRNFNFHLIALVMCLSMPRATSGISCLGFGKQSPGDQCTGTLPVALIRLTERTDQHGIFHAYPIAISRAGYQD
jgi:hypothetical protein